jgi:hypothetical protein
MLCILPINIQRAMILTIMTSSLLSGLAQVKVKSPSVIIVAINILINAFRTDRVFAPATNQTCYLNLRGKLPSFATLKEVLVGHLTLSISDFVHLLDTASFLTSQVLVLFFHCIESPLCFGKDACKHLTHRHIALFHFEAESTYSDFGTIVFPLNIWSGRRDSNPRHPPWQGGALPTELRPHLILYISVYY